jgi:crotonobetainyl-CoA:carnitine CoA-transferase CaiB-like acyl-CoA transferase
LVTAAEKITRGHSDMATCNIVIDKPLAGIKVLDLTIYVAGPAATTILGYLGADVIRIEPPKGDPYRLSGAGFGLPATEELNPLFDACNSYKRCLALNFRSDEGKAVMRRLIQQADILVTNYRDQALKGMCCTYEEAAELNPRMVYCKSNGLGYDGEDSGRAGYDATSFYARSGFANEASYSGAPPMVTPSGTGDTITSMAIASGILGAYIRTLKTGRGALVTSSLLSAALWVLESPLSRHQTTSRAGKEYPYGVPYFLAVSYDYRCKDDVWVRFCSMVVERDWEAYCKALGMEEYLNDKRFNTSSAQHENSGECFKVMQGKIGQKTWAECTLVFEKYDLAFEKVQSVEEAACDPQVLANHFVEAVSYPNGLNVNLAKPPFKISGLEDTPLTKGPKLGEHTKEILAEFGFSAGEIEKLVESGGVVQL